MTVSMDQVMRGVTNYFENEIGSKATGFKKFASYFVFNSSKNKITAMIQPFVNDDNTVDIDALYGYAKEAYNHSGQFTVAGIIFNESDIDKLYNEVTRA